MNMLLAQLQKWPLISPFSISRYTFTHSLILTARMSTPDGATGVGECEPHEWDEAAAQAQMADAQVVPEARCYPAWLDGLTRDNILQRLPRMSLRNAIDCALWDLDCKRSGVRAGRLAGSAMNPVPVMPTLGIDAPTVMDAQARHHRGSRWLKVKVGSSDGLDAERLEAVAAAVPGTRLLVDANCGWSPDDLARLLPLCSRLGVAMIEQPMLPQFNEQMPKPPGDLVFCADESCLDRGSLAAVRDRFQFINIKLDKTGGLTEALALRREAEAMGLGIMVGMMSGTSLAVAPAFVLAQGLEVVDLELGFLREDRVPAMTIDNGWLQAPAAALWG